MKTNEGPSVGRGKDRCNYQPSAIALPWDDILQSLAWESSLGNGTLDRDLNPWIFILDALVWGWPWAVCFLIYKQRSKGRKGPTFFSGEKNITKQIFPSITPSQCAQPPIIHRKSNHRGNNSFIQWGLTWGYVWAYKPCCCKSVWHPYKRSPRMGLEM